MVAPNPSYLAESSTALIGSLTDPLQTVLNTDLFSGTVNGWYDTGAYNTMYVQILGGATITAGAVTFECTNDPSNTVGQSLAARGVGAPTNAPFISAITVTSGFASIYQLNLSARYVRCRVSTAFTGAATGARIIAMMEEQISPYDLGLQNVSINGTPAVTISGTPTVSATISAPLASLTSSINSAATTNATSVKAGAGRVMTVSVANTNAAARYVKLYNKASAPTVGTDIPILTIPVAAGATLVLDWGFGGFLFSTGIAFAITGAAGDADATAVTAGDTKVAVTYI